MKQAVREMLLQKFAAKVSGFVKANGFNHNIGQQVYRSRRVYFEDELPCATVIDGAELATRDEYGGDRHEMEVSLQFLFQDENDANSEKVNELAAGFKNVIESGDLTLDELCEDIQYTGMAVQYPEEGVSTVAAELTYLITYVTPQGDPYTVMRP